MDVDTLALGISFIVISIIYAIYTVYKKIKTIEALNRVLIEANHSLSIEIDEFTDQFESLAKVNETIVSDLEAEINKNASLEMLYQTLKDKVNHQIKEMEATHKLEIKKARKESVEKSRAVIRGQATEHLAPYVMENVNPKDCRFMGNPIDYVVFDGLSDLTDKVAKDIKEVIFVDVKTGKSNLTTVQRRIRDAIKEGRVSFQVVNPDKKEKENADKSVIS